MKKLSFTVWLIAIAAATVCSLAAVNRAGTISLDVDSDALHQVFKEMIQVYPKAPRGAWITDEGWFAAPKPAIARPDRPEKITKAFVIPIHGEITLATYDRVRDKAMQCRAKGAQMIIFDMDTPGGRGDVMSNIIRLLMNDLGSIYRIAYVHPRAISAGAMISLACHEIVMAPRAIIGDAMPIYFSPDGKLMPLPEAERAKAESPALAEVRSQAVDNGYNTELCEAMITVKREIWLIRNLKTSELQLINADKNNWRTKAINAPKQKKAPTDATWEFIAIVDAADKLATLNSREAIRFGFSQHEFETQADLEKHYNITTPAVLLSDTWSESLVAWLGSPAVAGILMIGGIIGLITEIRTPGLGLPGAVAVICFGLLFGGKYLTGLAQWWEIALFILGVGLLILEVFVIPGFGVAGISGIICCSVGLLAIFIDNPVTMAPIPTGSLGWELLREGMLVLAIAFVLSIVGIVVLTRFLPHLPMANKLILAAVEASSESPVTSDSPMREVQIGDVGDVESMCRPVGRVRFGDALVDATSQGEIIEAGEKVRVLQNDSNRLIVEKVEDA